MIFFKEKTVRLGSCDAGMQEWLAGELVNWLGQKTLTDIQYVDNVISFYEARSAWQLWTNQNQMKYVSYGEIHFLPQDGGVDVIAKLRPTLMSKIGLCWIPVFMVIFSLVWLSDGKLAEIWFKSLLPMFIIIGVFSYLDGGPDDLLRRQTIKFILQKKREQENKGL